MVRGLHRIVDVSSPLPPLPRFMGVYFEERKEGVGRKYMNNVIKRPKSEEGTKIVIFGLKILKSCLYFLNSPKLPQN